MKSKPSFVKGHPKRSAITHMPWPLVSCFRLGNSLRHPVTNDVPGLQLGKDGEKISYDIRAETRATLENIRAILEDAGSSLERILEINVFLTDMKDFRLTMKSLRGFFLHTTRLERR